MRLAIIFSFIILQCLNSFSQNTLKGRIDAYPRGEISFCNQFGDESKLLEVISADYNGGFSFILDSLEFGLYRIYLSNNESFDLIYNNESIEFTTKLSNPEYNMIIIQSSENKQLYDYLVTNYIFDYKIDVLAQLAEIYPDGKFRKITEKELQKETTGKNKNIERVIKQNPNSFAGRYLSFYREVPVPPKFNDYQKSEYLKKNYLHNFKVKDLDLLNSDAYNKFVLNYFKLFRSNQQDMYYTAAKDIMDYVFFEDPKIVNYIFEYILSGFESMGLDEPAARLSLEFGEMCSDGDESLKLRIKSNTELSVGKKAPEIIATTISGKDYVLSQMKSKYTLMVFWATWCEHCKITMPRLATALSLFKKANIEIVAISIDSDEKLLKDFMQDNKMPWEVICEYKGWDGKIVVDYAVFATPLMIIVDNDLNIVSRPYNEDRLYSFIETILTE